MVLDPRVDTGDDFGCFVCQDGKVRLSRVFNGCLAAEHEAADPHNAAGVRVRGIERMNELIAMVQSTGRYPSSKAPEASARSLAAWLRHRRLEAKAGTLARAFRDGLDVLPDWQGYPRAAADEARWRERLNALAAYREAGHDWPRHKATDTAEEHGLGVWLHTQRYKLSRGDLDPAKKQTLDGAVPGWAAGRTRGRKPRTGNPTRQAGPAGATLIL